MVLQYKWHASSEEKVGKFMHENAPDEFDPLPHHPRRRRSSGRKSQVEGREREMRREKERALADDERSGRARERAE